MTNSKNRIKLTVIILVGFIALITGIFTSKFIGGKRINLDEFHGTWLENPRGINQFDLQATHKPSFTNGDLKGKWTLLFFGFTNCGYLCPTTLGELGKMYKILEEQGVKELPQVVLISIDPEKDSINVLKQYVNAFNPHFIGATGSENTLKNMTSEMGIAYAKVALQNNPDNENYSMEHTGTIMAFNPNGELKAFFTTPHLASSLAKDYQMLIS